LNLSADEKRVYGQLFRQADTDNVGVVTGEIAVKFFEKTRLDSRILGEVSGAMKSKSSYGQELTRITNTLRSGRSPTRRIVDF
jgi:epidermal growth factor receptor substrate 15